MDNTEHLKEYPHQTRFKNKRSHKLVKASLWGVNVRIEFHGTKRSKKGISTKGTVSRFISREDFNRKFYIESKE